MHMKIYSNLVIYVNKEKIHMVDSDLQDAHALLDPAYPEHVEDLSSQAPFYYYAVSHYGSFSFDCNLSFQSKLNKLKQLGQ